HCFPAKAVHGCTIPELSAAQSSPRLSHTPYSSVHQPPIPRDFPRYSPATTESPPHPLESPPPKNSWHSAPDREMVSTPHHTSGAQRFQNTLWSSAEDSVPPHPWLLSVFPCTQPES